MYFQLNTLHPQTKISKFNSCLLKAISADTSPSCGAHSFSVQESLEGCVSVEHLPTLHLDHYKSQG